MNKYERQPKTIIDLHGYTTAEAKEALEELVEKDNLGHVRIITGKGTFRETGPVLREFVKNYLNGKKIKFETAKLHNGGEGALEVFFG